jgi:cyclophilin family peptidyl-prolyl cis-trans isomerase
MRMLSLLLLLCGIVSGERAEANVVIAIQSVSGPIQLELFDAAAPLTVANFLGYADAHAYDQSFIHRSVPAFVIQGGGYKLAGNQIVPVATNPPTVPNEPGISNLRGTVAMAKVSGQPNSATTQWFVNVADNLSLDTDNGGFTVFGDVISGMTSVDAINSLPRVNIGSPFTELPVVNFTAGNPVTAANLVLLTSVARQTLPQCGDLNADAQIGAADVARLRSFLANPSGAALSPAEASRCSVIGTATDCNLLDSTVLRRRLAGRRPQRAQICPAAG